MHETTKWAQKSHLASLIQNPTPPIIYVRTREGERLIVCIGLFPAFQI